MKGTWIAAVFVGIIALMAGGTSGSSGDRAIDELARRLSRLESQVTSLERSVAALEKASSREPRDSAPSNRELARQVADLQKAVAALEKSAAKDSRDTTTAGKDLARQVADLQKAVAELKSTSPSSKDAAATRADLKAVSDRLNNRTSRLAEWLDQYHPRRDMGAYHRMEIERR